MMASHGRGQRVGLFGSKVLGSLALAAASLGVPGTAGACHYMHNRVHQVGTTGTGTTSTTPLVAAAEVLNPTSLVPPVPPLTPSTAPLPSVTSTTVTTVPVIPSTAGFLAPTPLVNPPAADLVAIPAAPPAVSAWHDAGPGSPVPASAMGSTCPPVTAPPSVTNPPAGQGINPPPSSLVPPLSGTVSTPEPSTIVSALVMMGAAVAYRRRGRHAR